MARFDFSQAVQAGSLPSHFTFAARHREQAATGLLTRSNGVSRTMRRKLCGRGQHALAWGGWHASEDEGYAGRGAKMRR